MPKFSIIIPFFNSFTLMRNCLVSLENQTLKNFELIFVDDCSTDDSFAELQGFLKNSSLSYKIVQNEVNSGPGHSRNVGVQFATAEYVSFIDSDDSVEPDYIEKFNKCTDKFQHDIVLFDYNRVLGGKVFPKSPTAIFNEDTSKNYFLAHAFDSMCCMLFKRELFNNISFPKLYNGEDVALIPLLISKSNSIGLIKEPLYNYHHNKDSLSNTIKPNVYLSFIKAFNVIRDSDMSLSFYREVEFLGIKIILYNSVLTAMKSGVSKKNTVEIISNFERDFQNWYYNPFIELLPVHKKIYVYLIFKRKYYFLKGYVWVHNLIFN